MSADLYGDLGVPRSAELAEIKRAYRKLTQKYHPDKNPGDRAAVERFKRIATAYGVLGDAEKRRNYDEFGPQSMSHGFDPVAAREARAAARAAANAAYTPTWLWDLVSQPAPPKPQPGQHIHEILEVPLLTALRGGRVPHHSGFIPIPKGTEDGGILRVSGRGKPGSPPGDLLLTIIVPAHPFLRVVPVAPIPSAGSAKHWPHLELYGVQVTWFEVYTHGCVHIPTPWGSWPLLVDPTTQDGKLDGVESVRIPGYGYRCSCKGPCNCVHGDITVYLTTKAPDPGDNLLRQALQRLQGREDVRADLVRSLEG